MVSALKNLAKKIDHIFEFRQSNKSLAAFGSCICNTFSINKLEKHCKSFQISLLISIL